MDADLLLKIIAALGGFGGTLTGIVYGLARYFSATNQRYVEKVEANAKERLVEKDAIISELKADNAEAKKLILQQSESQLRQIDTQNKLAEQQSQLITALQGAGKAAP